jgi:hypothetical protein
MVLPYLKGFDLIQSRGSSIWCHMVLCGDYMQISIGSIVIFCRSGIRYLTSGIRALSLGKHCGQIFFMFADVFFSRSRKKRARDIPERFRYIYVKNLPKTGCIYDFLSENHPI